MNLQSMRATIKLHMKPEDRDVFLRSVDEIRALNMATNDRIIGNLGTNVLGSQTTCGPSTKNTGKISIKNIVIDVAKCAAWSGGHNLYSVFS